MNGIDLKNVKNTISNLANEDDTKFHNWFDPTDSIDETLVRGNWDFSFHILKDKVCEYINNPHEKNVLEIGYGGGRLLNAACNFFNSATSLLVSVAIPERCIARLSVVRSPAKSEAIGPVKTII